MPKIPNPWQFRTNDGKPDMRLPDAALAFRRTAAPPLTSLQDLGRINVTAWLYRDSAGVEQIQVNPNTTIAQIKREFGPAPTRDAEVGFHSEGRAAEWFRVRPDLRVVQIFTERAPCAMQCAPLLRHYFPNVPTFYYYDRAAWRGSDGELLKRAGEILKTAYGL
jgi:hypothetical protein